MADRRSKKGRCCAYCDTLVYPTGSAEARHFPQRTRTIDHVVPFSVSRDDTDENKVVACRQCNSLKADYPEAFFLDFMIRHAELTFQEKVRKIRVEAFYFLLAGFNASQETIEES